MSKDSGTQTTQVQPWAPARPYVEQGMAGANTLLQQGGPQQYGGQTVIPFSQPTQQALSMQQARALGGSPVTGAAQNLATGTLNGDFLNSNPYLDATFQRGAGQIGNNLDSLFARSGRDLVAQAPARGEALASYATQLYGGNYANERGMQQQAMGMAPQLANQDYIDTAQLRDVGSTVENLAGQQAMDSQNRFNFEQQRPEMALDAFLQRINGGTSGYSSQTSPTYQNRGAGALGGAMVGSQLFGGGTWPTVIGGLLGGFG